MLEILNAKDGSRTIRCNNVQILSFYSPQKEAERFLQRAWTGQKKYIILCGETLGYLYSEIRRQAPDVLILTVFYHRDFPDYFSPPDGIFWHPGSPVPLSRFLQNNIPLLDSRDIEMIFWQASGTAFPGIAKTVLEEINQFFREASGSLSVIRQFGKKWIRNSIVNFLSLENLKPMPSLIRKPILIAASGPSLGLSFPLIHKNRPNLFLIALPSSLEALDAHGLTPDLVIQTDPGYYAGVHLRLLQNRILPVAMPLSASRGLWKSKSQVFFFFQDSYFEKTLFLQNRIRAPFFPSTGTVAASALMVALKSDPDIPILIAGLDLAARDIVTHIRPHSFDSVLEPSSGRTSPFLTILYERTFPASPAVPLKNAEISGQTENQLPREAGEKQSLPHKTYTGWINKFAGTLNRPVYRLFPSGIPIHGMLPLEEKELDEICSKGYELSGPGFTNNITSLSLQERSELTEKVLDEWLEKIIELKSNPDFLTKDSFFRHPFTQELLLSLAFLEVQKLKQASKGLETESFQKECVHLLEEIQTLLTSWKGDFLS